MSATVELVTTRGEGFEQEYIVTVRRVPDNYTRPAEPPMELPKDVADALQVWIRGRD